MSQQSQGPCVAWVRMFKADALLDSAATMQTTCRAPRLLRRTTTPPSAPCPSTISRCRGCCCRAG